MALLFTVVNSMYQAESFIFGSNSFAAIATVDISQMLDQTAQYRRMSAAALTLMWFSICSVKFCFLAFFKKLIRQMPLLNIYWWCILAFNVIVTGYGATVYLVACPYFRSDQVTRSSKSEIANIVKSLDIDNSKVKCVQGSGLKLAIAYSTSQMALDIVGDIFILVIPIVLIWKIRISWTQKVALAFTICLTIVMVIITIARIAGLKWKGKLDSVWETYFTVVAAEIGLALVAITAFRALYVSRSKNRQAHNTITSFNWYRKGRALAWRIIAKTTGKPPSDHSRSIEMGRGGGGFLEDDIPHGTMTGMRTFIDENGKTKFYSTMDEEA